MIYQDREQQQHAARLGMWAFLASEMLLFAGLFALYSSYRAIYAQDYRAAGHHMELAIGTANTYVLVTSSLTMALAIWAARTSRPRTCLALLLCTLAFGVAFLCLKGVEYKRHFDEGIFPGTFYAFAALPTQGARVFFTLYFFMTGLHAIHVLAGMCVVGWCARHAWARRWTPEHHTGLELGGMYWHLVDLIWLFIWPLLYLVE